MPTGATQVCSSIQSAKAIRVTAFPSETIALQANQEIVQTEHHAVGHAITTYKYTLLSFVFEADGSDLRSI